MTSKIRMAALLLLATACATGGAGKGPADRFKQADEKMPGASAIQEDSERAYYTDVLEHKRRGDIAHQAGNGDQARAEWATAAEGLGTFNDRFGANEYQIPIRYSAAELFMQAQQWEKAAQAAERTGADAHANAKTKAMANHLAAQAWLNAANVDVKAGKLEPIKLSYSEQRRGEELKPRTPPGAWKRFVDTTDAYLASIDADPEQQKPVAERRLIPAQQLALVAAEVQYAFDNMEEARRRFEVVLQRWPSDGDVIEAAAPLYLQTFLFAKDTAGHEAATKRVRDLVTAEAQKATDPKNKAAFEKVLQELGRSEAGTRFAEAQKLLESGKASEAARQFEALAADPSSGDVAGALHNAAIAWDKAGDSNKAAALRQRILKEFPESKVAPQNALLLAMQQSKKGDHAGAAKMYSEFVEKWPDNPNRCVALQNVAAELDTAKKTGEAAERYLVFGKDPACAKGDPNFAARALYRAGTLFAFAKKDAKAKEAFTAAVAVQGVTDTVAKSQIEDARRRLKK